jgi:hypothetical protein
VGGHGGVDFEGEREGAAAGLGVDSRRFAGADGVQEGFELKAEGFARSDR